MNRLEHGEHGGQRAAMHARAPDRPLRGLAALQRAAGNRAVSRWIAVQRGVGHEHESLGDVTKAHIDLGFGVVLTWGQVVAVAGDEIGSVEELKAAAASPEGRRRIRSALEHTGVRGPIPASLEKQLDPKLAAAEKEQQEKEYITLALENVSHFAAGGDALATWQGHHGRALAKAFEAGLSKSKGDAITGEDLFQNAQLMEAFGQHFLTDMFSGGHVRTPRKEIIAYYSDRSTAMAAAFEQNLRKRVEEAVTSQVMLQLGPRAWGSYPYQQAKEKVHEKVGPMLEKGLAKIGGRAGLARYFGLALAGAISGALPDRDGRRGVLVYSEAHPTPWIAKGDAKLDESPESRQQAELAVLTAREELLAARLAGEREHGIDAIVPSYPPGVIHFGFDSSALDPAGAKAAASAGAWLHANRGDSVRLTGHTDPLGTDRLNMDLGQRRANAVRSALLEGGARPDQITAASEGEQHLRATNPRRYPENRRVG